MEMIDVLNKLQEIAETKPELVKDAVESVEKTNPKNVTEFRNVVTPRDESHYREMMKHLQDMEIDPVNRRDPSLMKEIQQRRMELRNWAEKNIKKEDGLEERKPGGMSDIHIGADEYIGNYTRDDAPDTLKMPKADVLRAMDAEAKRSPFPKSYEIETAMKMVDEKFEDDGSPKDEMPEPDEVMASAEPQTTETPVQEKTIGQGLPIGTEAFLNMGSKLDINFSRDQAYMVSGVLNRLDQDALLKAVDEYKSQELDPDQAESKELNTNTMTTEGKKQVNEAKKVDEAITMTADSPEEAGMLMQMLKLAGVQQVTPDMIGAEEPAENPPHGEPGHVCGTDDDAIGSNDMGKMRDVVTAPDEEKAEENFANSEKEAERDFRC